MAGGKGGQIDHLVASAATLRVRVDALLNAADPPKDVVESTLQDLRAVSSEMKPLASVSSEFRKRWKKQKQALLQKREAEVEYHLRQASNTQLARMEAEAEDQIYLMHQDFEHRRLEALEDLHQGHRPFFKQIVDDWLNEVKYSDSVRPNMVEGAISEYIAKISDWALQEELRIMDVWEQELGRMMVSVHALDEEEVQAMEKARAARCNLMETTAERQQQDLYNYRSEMKGKISNVTKMIVRRAQPRDEKSSSSAASAKRQARNKASAKKEAEAASQCHIDAAVRYLDEAAALERARVSAYHTAMQEIGPELAEELQERLESETEAASSKTKMLNGWGSGGGTASGLPNTFGSNRSMQPQSPIQMPSPTSSNEDEDVNAAAVLQNEVHVLRERVRSMTAAVGRGDWRKDILEVADGAIEGLRQTEAALAAGPLQKSGMKATKSSREALAGIDIHSRDFSDSVLKEFTRMRNVKVALSCSRSKHVREAMQQYEHDSASIEDVVMPAVSKLCHEAEVVREVIHASKHGKEKMPIYIISAAFRRALVAAYPALKHLWEVADVPDVERKSFIRKLSMHLAMEPGLGHIFHSETSALEATLPAPDWAVDM